MHKRILNIQDTGQRETVMPGEVERLEPTLRAQALADDFMDKVFSGQELDLGPINLLCKMAMAADPEVAEVATAVLFRKIIEGLCDDFSGPAAKICALVLASILEFLRHQPAAREMDLLLDQAGFDHMDQLLERYERLAAMRPLAAGAVRSAKKIIVLSRVTVGADVAITSVILQRLASQSTGEIVMIGPSHLETIFGELGRIRFIPFTYDNSGSLLAKMTTWPGLLKIITREGHGMAPGEMLLFDPDTRLSQLGLLPLVDEQSTCYFPSRSCGDLLGREQNLSVLANLWLDRILGPGEPVKPRCGSQPDSGSMQVFRQQAAAHGCEFLISVNLGVGYDERKKMADPFEQRLFDALLQQENTLLVLDTGQGGDEGLAAGCHLSRLGELGHCTGHLKEQDVGQQDLGFGQGIVTFQASLAGLGALMNASDCFIGYDSCGQHIATALGTPAVILFAGAPSERFRHRWTPDRPHGITLPVHKAMGLTDQEIDSLVAQVVKAVNEIRQKL